MACRGYFLALDEPCVALLLAQDGNDERLIEVIKELDMDKAWDGIHRCLTEGRLGGEDGTHPLNAVILYVALGWRRVAGQTRPASQSQHRP